MIPITDEESLDQIAKGLPAVQSSNLIAMGFMSHDIQKNMPDETIEGRLLVQFKRKDGSGGDIWAYDGVRLDTYTAILESESIGIAFNQLVKNDPMRISHRIDFETKE